MDHNIRPLFAASALPPRDEVGSVEHPDLSSFSTDQDGEGYINLADLKAAGWEYHIIAMEQDGSEADQKRYFDEGDPDFSQWCPATPDGWQLAGMWETDDGPIAFYVRELQPVAA
jgi:hypothetical protein